MFKVGYIFLGNAEQMNTTADEFSAYAVAESKFIEPNYLAGDRALLE